MAGLQGMKIGPNRGRGDRICASGVNNGVKIRGTCDKCKKPITKETAITIDGSTSQLCRKCWFNSL